MKNLPIKLKMFQMPCNARHIIVKTSHSLSPLPQQQQQRFRFCVTTKKRNEYLLGKVPQITMFGETENAEGKGASPQE